ncbi:cation:proton antiporter [Demequina sp.]|uniref:cation:proton antiporter n=1 Tax=Demequina sp. TaxID=2050685 RepID=UPI003D145B7A
MELLAVAVLGLICIAFATLAGPRLGIAAPLLLVALGVAASLVPGVPEIVIEPEIILAGILPPLLYAAAVSIPATDFRREIRSISGLSVVLVIISTVVLGFLFQAVIPGMTLPWAFALGAIVSPTDAVATGIIRRLGINPRVVTVLEGESMLNDAVALVLVRASVGAAAVAVSLWGVTLQLVYSMAVAAAIGWAIGRLNLWVRGRISDPVVTTVISFTVPFVASIPAELLNSSGLVAAVVAGLVTGAGAARALAPQQRVSDRTTWKAIEMVLEGAVYLIMGLEIVGVVNEVRDKHQGVTSALWIAALALAATLLVRAAFVGPLVWQLHRRALRAERMQPKIEKFRERVDSVPHTAAIPLPPRRGKWRMRRASRDEMRQRLTRLSADIAHMIEQPLGWREGTVIVWAGMRGVVTIAAVQTLPHDAPSRAMLVLIAFLVAVASLGIQGGTMGLVMRWLKPDPGPTPEQLEGERHELAELLNEATAELRARLSTASKEDRVAAGLELVKATREALLDIRDLGTFSAAALEDQLRRLDADQMRLEL